MRHATSLAPVALLLFAMLLPSVNAQTFAPSELRCEYAKRISDGGHFEEYAVLGDCYFHGVYVEQSLHEARYYYMQAVLNGSQYGQLRLGVTELFEREDKYARSVGYYFLHDLAESQANEYRQYARYYLGVFFANRDQPREALFYFDLALEDGSVEAQHARTYLELQANIEKVLSEDIKITGPGEEKQISLPCWIALQPSLPVSFRTNPQIDQQVFDSLGPCEIDPP